MTTATETQSPDAPPTSQIPSAAELTREIERRQQRVRELEELQAKLEGSIRDGREEIAKALIRKDDSGVAATRKRIRGESEDLEETRNAIAVLTSDISGLEQRRKGAASREAREEAEQLVTIAEQSMDAFRDKLRDLIRQGITIARDEIKPKVKAANAAHRKALHLEGRAQSDRATLVPGRERVMLGENLSIIISTFEDAEEKMGILDRQKERNRRDHELARARLDEGGKILSVAAEAPGEELVGATTSTKGGSSDD
jgi:hypothetical protein